MLMTHLIFNDIHEKYKIVTRYSQNWTNYPYFSSSRSKEYFYLLAITIIPLKKKMVLWPINRYSYVKIKQYKTSIFINLCSIIMKVVKL